MNFRDLCAVAVLVGVGALFPVQSAHAKDKYQSTVVPMFVSGTYAGSPSDLTFAKSGKVQIYPSLKPGDGGIVLKLILSHVDCPIEGNDGGVTGACGVAGTPLTNNVFSIGIDYAGLALDETAGVPFYFEKGKAVFQATGKNKVTGAIFGALGTAIYNQPLGIGLIRLRGAGSNPAACSSAPLSPGNGCTDGNQFAIAGITAGNDSGISCTVDTDCNIVDTCTLGLCTAQSCSVPGDCRSGHCAATGTCCDPGIDPTCP